MKFIITKRNLIENLLDLEFKEPIQSGFFYAGKYQNWLKNIFNYFGNLIQIFWIDEDNTFKNAIFAGHERKLFIFDLALFLFIDYFAKNYVLAAFICYIVQQVFN